MREMFLPELSAALFITKYLPALLTLYNLQRAFSFNNTGSDYPPSYIMAVPIGFSSEFRLINLSFYVLIFQFIASPNLIIIFVEL